MCVCVCIDTRFVRIVFAAVEEGWSTGRAGPQGSHARLKKENRQFGSLAGCEVHTALKCRRVRLCRGRGGCAPVAWAGSRGLEGRGRKAEAGVEGRKVG